MRTDLLNEQLGIIASHIPTVYVMSLISTDGLIITEWPLPDTEISQVGGYSEESRYTAMAAATLSIGERIADEMAGGNHNLTILQGELGTIFLVVVGDTVFQFGVRQYRSVDEVLWILQQQWGELLRLLDVAEPPKL